MELANTQIKIIRNEKIDICKGIGILLVVLGHTCYFDYFHKLVYCFHMPLFFLLSGYCIKKKYTILDFIKKRFKSLILPFFYFAVIEILMTTSIKRQFLWEYFYPNIGHTLWFLPVLFISITIVYSLILLNDKIILLSVLFLFFQGGIITNAISQLPYSMKSIIFASIFTGGGGIYYQK